MLFRSSSNLPSTFWTTQVVSTRLPPADHNKLEGIVSQSFLRLTVDNSSQQGNDKNTLQTIRSIIKIILRLTDSLSVIPPAYQEVPAIRGNKELPTRDNVKMMRRYMHQCQMSPTYFSGKLLVGHPNGHTILTEEVTTAIKMSCPWPPPAMLPPSSRTTRS